jgi:hypothetical protein
MKREGKKIVMVALSCAAAAFFFCGCATISENTHAYIGSPHLAPTNPASVQILAAEPRQPIERLGEVILSVDGNPPRAEIDRKLQKAAAKLGATGVYVASDRTHIYPVYYWDWYGPMADEYWHRLIVGVAFVNK